MAGIFSLRNWVMKQLMKPDKSGIMKIPPKGKVDFGEMLLREQLFQKGIHPKMIKNEKQLDNIINTPAVPKSERVKPKKSGKVIEVDFDKGRWNKAGGGKAKESWTDKLVRWGGGPSVLAGELGLEGINQIYQLLNMPGLYNQGGRAGLSYLLAEDTNERMPLAGGGTGKPPINFYANFSASAGKKGQNIYGVEGLNEKGYNYGGTFAADTTFPLFGGDLSVGGELGIGRNKRNVDYKGQPIDFLSNVGETKLGDDWNVGFKWRKKFSGGGMGRRAFLKLMAALGLTGAAAKYGLPTLLKKGPKVSKSLTQVPIKNIKGMPAWFKPLVNKVIKEGTEVNSGAERVIAHKTKLPNSKTDVYVNQDLSTGDVWVDLGVEKHGFPDGKHGQPVRLDYKASEVIEPSYTKEGDYFKGHKTKEEFNVEEAEFTGGHPENVKFEESTIEKFGDHGSNFDEVEMFATGKVKKKTGKAKIKAEREHWVDDRAPEADDFASGGLARMLGE